jgi:hypothetical protein
LTEDKKEKNIKVGDLVCFRLNNPSAAQTPLWQYVRDRRPPPGVVISIFHFPALERKESEGDKILFAKIRWSSGLITEEEIKHIYPFRECYEQEQKAEERERGRKWREKQGAWDWSPEED